MTTAQNESNGRARTRKELATDDVATVNGKVDKVARITAAKVPASRLDRKSGRRRTRRCRHTVVRVPVQRARAHHYVTRNSYGRWLPAYMAGRGFRR